MSLNARPPLAWRKASASGTTGCIEVASLSDGGVAIRDSKLGDIGPVLAFTAHEWTCFLDGMAKGEFDDLRRTPV